MSLQAPFPYFGAKSRPAPLVWEAFGADVPNYIEPFYGSGAVLLGRPGGAGKIETANDLDGHVVNFWRCMALQPDETAKWADWPVSELDLHARHAWLVEQIPSEARWLVGVGDLLLDRRRLVCRAEEPQAGAPPRRGRQRPRPGAGWLAQATADGW